MIEIIAGEKGKGKTKHLLDKVNHSVKSAKGSIVYLDKSPKHMYELDNKIRLIDVAEYPISNCDEFMGFLCGIISQNRDIEEMYLDSFLTISSMKDDEMNDLPAMKKDISALKDQIKKLGDVMTHAIKKLDVISETFSVKFILSVSKDERELPECARAKLILSL